LFALLDGGRFFGDFVDVCIGDMVVVDANDDFVGESWNFSTGW